MPPERTRRVNTVPRGFYIAQNISNGSRQEASPEWIRQQIASRRTAAQEAALNRPPSLLDPHQHMPALDAMLASYERPRQPRPSSRSHLNAPHAGSPALSYSYRERARASSHPTNYIDLTEEDEAPNPADKCLAYCSRCKPPQHLNDPFNNYLAQCPCCQMVERTRDHPCTCPPPDHDADLRSQHPDLAAALDAANPPLSNLAKRVLLLVAQVPFGRYTTYIALSDIYRKRWGMTSRQHMGSALKKREWWDRVPVHRVVEKNASIGGVVEWGAHGQDVDQRIELLEEEGVRFDIRGKLLGSSFCEFK